MAARSDRFPGFTTVTDQIFVREGEKLIEGTHPAPDHPRVVIVYAWGDAIPKHVAKYTDGFRKLFQHARQIVVLAPILKAMRQDLETRADNMKPIINLAYPGADSATTNPNEDAVLLHVMSNTGGINYAGTLYAYQQKYGRAMPHRLSIYDSTPGSVVLTIDNLKRWSLAMALGTANWFPWPFVMTQCIMGVFLLLNQAYEYLIGRESAPVFSVKAIGDPRYVSKGSRKLFLYSKEDPLIGWKDIEQNMAESKVKGYAYNAVIFEGSGHVGHMRMFPDKYWGAIADAWKET
ncbi:paxu protein [Colletotrichum incanum]|uniref:Paxu protein n=1 Tax=Colletotrichum incanum TaxID=1573173 RepID=A0A167CGI2_COLIC|nr:paxu protein [Colletotrichum incanum]OHW89814.1 paxu protein [Colletotrichum incanum]